MLSQGRPNLNLSILLGLLLTTPVMAGTLTIRDIQTKANQIEIQLDGSLPRNSVDVEYVRDIVQVSVQNTTIYPAKIIHAENQAFSKIFAYQYSPSMVRVRFSVEGASDAFRGKVKWQQKGKSIWIDFPEAGQMPAKTEKNAEVQEKSLLAKVISASKKSSERNDIKVEKINKEEAREEKPVEKTAEKAIALKSVEENADASEEAKPRLTGHASNGGAHLSGMKSPGPSVFRSFLAMFLVVGGLGLVLVYVKKKKGSVQAKKVGDSWFSGLIPSSMKKQKSFIEVIAQHPIGPKQSLIVVRIRGQQFVLGVTQDHVQLISQLDADEAELDLLDDPAVAASIGKMFGGKPAVSATPSLQVAPVMENSASFNSMLKKSDGAGAVMARQAYQKSEVLSGVLTEIPEIKAQQNGIRDQIRRRLEGMRNV